MSKALATRIDELAELMDKYRLGEAELSGENWRVAFKRRSQQTVTTQATVMEPVEAESVAEEAIAAPEVPAGIPISSPMTGIFYGAQSPSAPPFVKEGDSVTAGQVVALIEAMKVFNEIVAPVSGIVRKVVAQSGQVVAPGEPLLYIG